MISYVFFSGDTNTTYNWTTNDANGGINWGPYMNLQTFLLGTLSIDFNKPAEVVDAFQRTLIC